MFSWADVESRIIPKKRDDQLREYAQMEMGNYAFPSLLYQIFGGVAGQGRPKKKIEGKKDRRESEVHIEASHQASTR